MSTDQTGSPDRDGKSPENRFGVRELSKLEQQEMEKAKIRQKENIVKPQVIMGKEFKGNSFIAKPDKIIFKDFDVGQMHVQTIQMTNISYSFNSLKLLELNEGIKDFFQIIYKPSGRIGAGISVPIVIKFLPQLNEDILDFVPFLSETGPINVPLQCTCKKAVVGTEQKEIIFTKVIFGESMKHHLKLKNEGALETEIVFKNQKGVPLGQLYDVSTTIHSMSSKGGGNMRDQRPDYDQEEEKMINQLKFEKKTRIKGYSEISVPIEFVPTEIGVFDYQLVIYFDNFLHSPPINVLLRCECIEVPIYVEKPLYDFEICLLNHIYREQILFFNRSSIAMKAQIEMPKEAKRFFEFNPSLGYIQGNSKFEIWVKFIADPDIMKICKKFITDNVLTLPFKLIGADQVMPVDFEIKIKISTDKLVFSPQTLDFGRFYEQTAPARNLKIDNLSDLPQEVIFYPLPKNVKVFPDLIPIKVLPKQSVNMIFTYKGNEVTNEENHIRCKIATGTISTRESRILYKSEVLRSPLQFSSMRIDLPALQINEKYPAILTVHNDSNRAYIVEFFLPYFELCGLKLTPMVASIEPGKSLDVMVEYYSFTKRISYAKMEQLKHMYENDPNKNFQLRLKMKEDEAKKKEEEEELKAREEEDKKKGAKKPAPPKKEDPKKPQKLTKQQQAELEAEQQRHEEEEKRREEEERQKRDDLESNFDQVGELRKLGGKFYAFNEEEEGTYNEQYEWLVPCYFAPKTDHVLMEQNTTYIQINTATVMKNLITDKDVIEFGEIAVGFRKVEELLITNNSEHVADLKMDLLPLYGGFSVIGALRSIAPGKTKSILIQFSPHDQQKFDETLRLFTSTSMVSVRLIGAGVKPEVMINPTSGILNMGGVVHGEHIEKSFKIFNQKNFALNFTLKSQVEGVQNKTGQKVFSFIPAQGTVEANKEQDVRVIFKPDRINEKFYELVLIDVPNQIEPKSVYLVGHCFPRQAYVKLYKPLLFPKKEELEGVKHEYPLDYLTVKDEETIYGSGNNRIVLEFHRVQAGVETTDELAFIRKVSIGSCKMLDPKNEKAVNFDVTMPKDDKQSYFTCDLPKGAVASGQETVISFKFKPPEPDPFIANIEAIHGIGQWIEQKAEIKITGGFIKPGTTDLILLEVILRAYINQV